MDVPKHLVDPRFAEARSRKEAALRKAHAASKALEETLGQVSATNLHQAHGRSDELERVKFTEPLLAHDAHRSVADRMRDRTGMGRDGTDPMVAEQRKEWKKNVKALRAKGLEPPRDYAGERIGDSTDAAPRAAAEETAETPEETAAERAERRAMEKARSTVMRSMGIPDKRGPKLAEGPHLVDHVRALRQFSSASGDPFVSESKAAFTRDDEFDEVVAKNARRKDHKLCKNAFTEYTEAVAMYGKMMGPKAK